MANGWEFAQLEGPTADRKVLGLDGYSAPFGRPRQKPVAKEIIKARVQTTNYPGRSGKPTRHAFGTNNEPMELTGRWMTKHLVADNKTANSVADDWRLFIEDQRTCRISWGYIVSYTGFIEELELGRESGDEIAWRMKILIDTNDGTENQSVRTPAKSIAEHIVEFSLIPEPKALLKPVLPSLDPTFLDSLDNFASALNGPSAAFNRLVGQFSDIEKATFSTLQHFRSAITGFEKALSDLQLLAVSTTIDGAMLIRSAENDVAWVKFQLTLDDQVTGMLGILADLNRQVDLRSQSLKGAAGKLITAKDGDSWESLSTRATGSPGQASAIRSMNGATYGQRPEVGEIYLAP